MDKITTHTTFVPENGRKRRSVSSKAAPDAGSRWNIHKGVTPERYTVTIRDISKDPFVDGRMSTLKVTSQGDDAMPTTLLYSLIIVLSVLILIILTGLGWLFRKLLFKRQRRDICT